MVFLKSKGNSVHFSATSRMKSTLALEMYFVQKFTFRSANMQMQYTETCQTKELLKQVTMKVLKKAFNSAVTSDDGIDGKISLIDGHLLKAGGIVSTKFDKVSTKVNYAKPFE